MKSRTHVTDLENLLEQEVEVKGWVDRIRDMRRIQFMDLRDNTGYVQASNFKSGRPIDDVISDLPAESTVKVYGEVVPNKNRLNDHEIQIADLEVYSKPQGVIPITADAGVEARLDWPHLDIRRPERKLIFDIQTTAEHAMREWWMQNGFTEMHSPKLISGASESGSELFTLDYFGKTASLAQSPQFYKQMAMAAGMDKVFEIGPVFRANKSRTKRHDTEFTMIDKEIAWIDSHEDVMQMEEEWLSYVLSAVAERHGDEIYKTFGKEVVVPKTPFPRMTLADTTAYLQSQGYQADGLDLDPEAERQIGKHVKDKYGSEFVYITDYPNESRPFYHMRDDTTGLTKSFDLLWGGIEVTTGAQREHRYDKLMEQIAEKGVDPESLGRYTDFFKYGIPPHGGCGIGLTRLLMNITGIDNVRDVTYVYRGVNRLTP